MSTQVQTCGEATITFTIDDVNNEVNRIDVTTGSRALRLELCNTDGGVKAGVTISANDTVGQNLGPSQRVQTYLQKGVVSFPHRIFEV